jgi:hypothetical protein
MFVFRGEIEAILPAQGVYPKLGKYAVLPLQVKFDG